MARRLTLAGCVRRLRRGVQASHATACAAPVADCGHSPRGNARSTRGVAQVVRESVLGREDPSHRPRTAAGRFCSQPVGNRVADLGLPRQRSLQPSGDQDQRVELGKRDPAYPGGSDFLATGKPGDRGRSMAGGANQAKASADGLRSTIRAFVGGINVATFRDTERPTSAGNSGCTSRMRLPTSTRLLPNGC